MNIAMIIAHFCIGSLLLLIALIVKYNQPKKINALYGYRTKRSMQSEESWVAANRYSTVLMIWIGIITSVSQIVLYFFLTPRYALLLATSIMTILFNCFNGQN